MWRLLGQLDGLLKRKVINEQEFTKTNEAARSQKADLEKRKAELLDLLKKAEASEALIERVPRAITAFD